MVKRNISVVFIPIIILLVASFARGASLFDSARHQMVEKQLRARDITDERVLQVMGQIPREEFVSKDLKPFAYRDHPLPIGNEQTISQPYIVALMTQLLSLKQTDRVLEIGTGSGYQAAVLSKLAKDVYTIEVIEELAEEAEKRLLSLGYSRIHVMAGDGYYGWPKAAPFNAIMVTAAAPFIPQALIDQLADGGRLVIPLGQKKSYQTLVLVTKEGDKVEKEQVADVRFVPMSGKILK